MVEKTYNVEYLPLAVIDLQEISDYITSELKAPLAALNLLANLEESISNLEIFPFCGLRYKGNRMLEYDYRMLSVENYIVFYVVFEDSVEIHRVIYGKRKLDNLL